MAKSTAQVVQVKVDGTAFNFSVDRASYNKYINNITMVSKVAPSHNLLVSTIQADQKEALLKLIEDNAGSECNIASAVHDEYTPDLEIIAKKL